jgi:hypothetical protein
MPAKLDLGIVSTLVRWWGSEKKALAHTLQVSEPTLHVHVGLLLFVLACIITRRGVGKWTPLLVVLAFELANEASDFIMFFMSRWRWTPGETVLDIVLTMIWPTVLTLLGRYGPWSETLSVRARR